MEILFVAALALVAFGVFSGMAKTPVATDARENFRAVHGRYPTEADYEDPIA